MHGVLYKLSLPDYSFNELARIASKTAVERFDCTLGKGVEEELAELMRVCHADEISKHNASLPIRLVEEALGNMTDRVMLAKEAGACLDEDDLRTLRLEDFAKWDEVRSCGGRGRAGAWRPRH